MTKIPKKRKQSNKPNNKRPNHAIPRLLNILPNHFHIFIRLQNFIHWLFVSFSGVLADLFSVFLDGRLVDLT